MRLPLLLKDLERCWEKDPQDPEERWGDLGFLAPHLQDHLVLVDRAQVSAGGPCSLAVFQAHNEAKDQLYVLVTSDGVVRFGRTDRLAESTTRQLDGFSPLWHGVVSVAITDRHRFVGERWDLWIVVRRAPETSESVLQTMAYHGLISLEKDGLLLEPAQDDGGGGNSQRWEARPAERLPEWLRCWSFVCSCGTDPFDPLPPPALREIQKVEADPADQVEVVAWSKGRLGLAVADEVRLWHEGADSCRSFSLGEWVKALALTDDLPGSARGVAGPDARLLVAFEEKRGELRESWRQAGHEFPVALAFLASERMACSGWPDLLVVFHDGELQRLRYAGNIRIREAWFRAWHRLGLDTAEKRMAAAADERWRREAGWRRAALIGTVEKVLEEVAGAAPALREVWLDRISGLFQSEKDPEVPLGALELLLQALRESVESSRAPWPLPDGGDFLVALIHGIYTGQTYFSLQDQINQTFRDLRLSAEQLQDPDLRELHDRSARTRETIWREPEPSLDDPGALVYHSIFGLERWASAYVQDYTVHLDSPRDTVLAGLAGFTAATGEGVREPWVVVARRGELQVHGLPPDGTLAVGAGGSLALERDAIRAMAYVPGSRADRLVAAGSSGTLYLLELEPETGRLELLARHVIGDLGSAWALACIATPAGLPVIAASYNARRRSTLVLLSLQGDQIREMARSPLDLPRVRALDLASDGGTGFVVAAGAAVAAPVRIYWLDDKGRVLEKRPFRVLKSGALALRFSSPENPNALLAGERNGFLWCADLKQRSNLSDLRWTYDLGGAVRAIEAVEVKGQAHFLVGSEHGRLALLHGHEGRRIWKHRVREPVRQIRRIEGAKGDVVAVAMSNGWLAVFRRVGDRDAALRKVKEHLAHLAGRSVKTDEPFWRTATAETVQALFQLICRGESFLSVLQAFLARETRARLVRYLAEEIRPADVRDTVVEILKALTLRELTLLLSYLPDRVDDWDSLIWKELGRRSPQPLSGDNSKRAAMAAVATFLQRLARRSPDPASLPSLPEESFAMPWVRLEYARVLLLQTASSTGLAHQRTGRLLPWVFPQLLQLPPALAEACGEVLRYRSEDERDFFLLRRMINDLARSAAARAEDVEEIAASLHSRGEGDASLLLLSSLIELFVVYLREDSEDWAERRSATLEALRRSVQTLSSLKNPEPPISILAERLRQFLPDEPPPRDHDTLSQRASWLQVVSRRLEQPVHQERGLVEHPWLPVAGSLAAAVRVTVEKIVRLETGHVLSVTRPYLQARIELEDDNRVQVHLTAEPEGKRPLTHVSILFEAGGEGGLLPPGVLADRLDALQYPGKSRAREIVFSGFVRPGQERVTIRVSLQDETGYQAEDLWSFKIPRRPAHVTGRVSLPADLPRAFDRYLQSVVESRAAVTLAVIDGEELGRDAFIEEWLRRTHGKQVDLDAALHDTGAGRRYSARSLDLELIEGSIPNAPEPPLLLAPVGQLLRRLIDGEVKGLLQEWLASLRKRAAERLQPRLVMVVSSEHACHLRALGLQGIAELAAHRIVWDTGGARAALQEEIDSLVQKETGLGAEAARERLDQLGWDLRLVLGWLRWLKEEPGRALRPAADYLAGGKAQKLLRLELGSLAPFDLINVIMGAEAVTVMDLGQVEPGHFAAEDYHSTTRRSTPKLLQRGGSPFSERSLSSLRSDLNPPQKVRIQGIGNFGTTEAVRTRLLTLASYPRREQREESWRRLAARGLGAFVHRIFRTGPPYRELIRGLYGAAVNQPEGRRDAAVWAELLGKDRSPLESLSITELSSIQSEDFRRLLPEADAADLRRLQRIGRLWEPEAPEDVGAIVGALFRPEPVSRLELDKDRWDKPLAGLPWPVFGVGQRKGRKEEEAPYPEEYMVWSSGDPPLRLEEIGRAADEAAQRWQEFERKAEQNAGGLQLARRRAPKVTVFGPGADGMGYDETRRVAILRPADFCHAAWEGRLVEGVRRRTQAQMRMTALSPFQASGALPAGSPLFVGREDEISYIQGRIRAASLLIIGSRRVGKTSLLNQIDSWARKEADLAPIFVDLQGCLDGCDFMKRLKASLVTSPYAFAAADDLDTITKSIRDSGKLPVFLLNEVDGVVVADPPFVASWRGLNDRQSARFLMVGYSAIATLGIPDQPFFHFTEGRDFGGKAVVLTALSEQAARKLLDLLEESELQIRWTSASDREKAYRLCLDRSYRIPWVLQRYGQLLVEHLEKERRSTLGYQDVELVVAREGRVVWQYIEAIDYKSLGYRGLASARRPGFQLVLVAVARQRYFLGGREAPIRDPRLPDRSPLHEGLGFTVGEARDIVKETLTQLLVGRERTVVERWFDELDLEQALRLLTLTLMLEPDPVQDGRYGFLLHILPRELAQLYGEKDPILDNLVVQHAVEFLRFMDRGEAA